MSSPLPAASLGALIRPSLRALRGPLVALDVPHSLEPPTEEPAQPWIRAESGLVGGTAPAREVSERPPEALLLSLRARGPLAALAIGALPPDAVGWLQPLGALLEEGGVLAIALPGPRRGLGGLWARAKALRAPACRRPRAGEELCEALLAARMHRIHLRASSEGTFAWGHAIRKNADFPQL